MKKLIALLLAAVMVFALCACGAKTEAPDLRGGAALVGAALCAEGTSEISRAEYIDRGYEDIEGNIRLLGGKIRRVTER